MDPVAINQTNQSQRFRFKLDWTSWKLLGRGITIVDLCCGKGFSSLVLRLKSKEWDTGTPRV